MRILERYVAVDHVCAWPNMLKIQDGSLVVTGFSQPSHGGVEGALFCWKSKDGKGFWEKAGVPGPNDPGQNRMNHSMGFTHGGELIVMVSGWNKGGDPNAPSVNPGGTLQPFTAFSKDGGHTWRFGQVAHRPLADRGAVPFGNIIKLGGQTLATGVYVTKRRDRYTEEELRTAVNPRFITDAYMMISHDDGQTWNESVLIGQNLTETSVFALTEQQIIAIGRTSYSNQAMDLLRSMDGGNTWKTERASLTGEHRHPPDIKRLNDGRLLLTYGVRSDIRGIAYRVGSSDAVTWWEPRMLLDLPIASDMGYPSTAQLDDGTLATAYYCDRDTGHTRYHMGVIHWQL